MHTLSLPFRLRPMAESNVDSVGGSDPEAGHRDVYCSRVGSQSCAACASAEPSSGPAMVGCQWVADGSHGACVAIPGANSTFDLVSWLARHRRLAEGSTSLAVYEGLRPACRLVVRDVDKCPELSPANSDEANACTRTPPACGECTARGPFCGFCGEGVVGNNISGAEVRCVARADFGADLSPCALRCDRNEQRFSIGVDDPQGVLEYPFWGRFGLTYAPRQNCSWHVRGPFVGSFVRSSLTHQFAGQDSLRILDSSHREEPLHVVDVDSETPLVFSRLIAPFSVEFRSDSDAESFGFSFSWAAAGNDSADNLVAEAQLNNPQNSQVPIILLWVLTVCVVVICVATVCDCVRRCCRYSSSSRSVVSHISPRKRQAPPPPKHGTAPPPLRVLALGDDVQRHHVLECLRNIRAKRKLALPPENLPPQGTRSAVETLAETMAAREDDASPPLVHPALKRPGRPAPTAPSHPPPEQAGRPARRKLSHLPACPRSPPLSPPPAPPQNTPPRMPTPPQQASLRPLSTPPQELSLGILRG